MDDLPRHEFLVGYRPNRSNTTPVFEGNKHRMRQYEYDWKRGRTVFPPKVGQQVDRCSFCIEFGFCPTFGEQKLEEIMIGDVLAVHHLMR